MRCKITKATLPSIWRHPNLDGQMIVAYDKRHARILVMEITGKDLDVEGFENTGLIGWRPRMLSTADDLSLIIVKDVDMEPEC